MKTIYIDTLICANLFIDFLILLLIKRILHLNVRTKRILLGSIVASATTLSILFPIQSIFISALYKISTTAGIIYISFGKCRFRNFTVRTLTYLGISMILSTAVITVNLMWKPVGVFIYNNALYFDISPAVLLITTGVMYLILIIYNRMSSAQKLRCSIHKVTVSIDKEKKITFESALDTGCNLKEPFSGLPVILLERDIIKDVHIKDENMRIIPYTTAAGDGSVYGFRPLYLDIDGKELHSGCYIGLCNQKLHGEIKSIMGPELMEVI